MRPALQEIYEHLIYEIFVIFMRWCKCSTWKILKNAIFNISHIYYLLYVLSDNLINKNISK